MVEEGWDTGDPVPGRGPLYPQTPTGLVDGPPLLRGSYWLVEKVWGSFLFG